MSSIAKRSEEISEKISLKLVNLIRDSNNILVIHCGDTYGLVQHISSILKVSKPQLGIMVADGDYVYNILLPYIAEATDLAIIYSDVMHEKTLSRLIHSIFINNIRSIFIIPSILYEKYKVQWSRGYENIDVIEIDNSVYRLALLLTALKVGTYIGGSIARVNRMRSEVEITPIVEEIIDRYRDAIKSLETQKNVIVSKTMLPVGEYLEEHSYNVYTMSFSHKSPLNRYGKASDNFILFYSSVEDRIVNEFVIEALRKGFKREQLMDVRINTDPFTAPIYGILISMTTILGS